MKYSYNGNQLTVKNKKVEFLSSIEKIVDLNDKLLVLVKDESTKDKKKHGNIFAVSAEGKILWAVQVSKPFEGWYRPFTGIYVRDNIVIAYSPIGVEYKVNLDNGELVDMPDQRPW
jgi:hypothetical protein